MSETPDGANKYSDTQNAQQNAIKQYFDGGRKWEQ